MVAGLVACQTCSSSSDILLGICAAVFTRECEAQGATTALTAALRKAAVACNSYYSMLASTTGKKRHFRLVNNTTTTCLPTAIDVVYLQRVLVDICAPEGPGQVVDCLSLEVACVGQMRSMAQVYHGTTPALGINCQAKIGNEPCRSSIDCCHTI